MTPDPQAPTLEEAIAWLEEVLAGDYEIQRHPSSLVDAGVPGVTRTDKRLRVLLEAARDGQRLRELRNPEGFVRGLENEARLFDMIEAGGGGRIDALTARKWAETFRAVRRIILRPAEPVTPSAEEADG